MTLRTMCLVGLLVSYWLNDFPCRFFIFMLQKKRFGEMLVTGLPQIIWSHWRVSNILQHCPEGLPYTLGISKRISATFKDLSTGFPAISKWMLCLRYLSRICPEGFQRSLYGCSTRSRLGCADRLTLKRKNAKSKRKKIRFCIVWL
jgi:hypothetical protein